MREETNTNEKILTIDKVRFVDKWVEFWFKEKDIPPVTEMSGGWQLSCKGYMLWNAVDRSGLNDEIMNTGFHGRLLKWKKDQYNNWEIDSFINI